MKLTQRTYSDLMSVLAKDNAERAARREQARRARDADPEWQAIRRGRQEMMDRERAAEEAKKAEAAKHAMVGWPGGLSAHVDRGAARTKASFAPYLRKAVEDYERDHPDQAPVPTPTWDNGVDDVIHHRELESRARARRLLEDGVPVVEKAKMLEVRHSYIGDQEFSARLAVRQQLREVADPLEGENPMEGENTVEVQDNSTPAPTLETADPVPVKRGRGRPSKASKVIEMTDDGALFEV